MIILDAGTSGTHRSNSHCSWHDLGISATWQRVIAVIAPHTIPRHIQVIALTKSKILSNRHNLIVSAPTNSGKTLIGLLILLDAIRQGKRGVLLEPLRALAQEHADRLERISAELGAALNRPITVRIMTGDYRLEDEAMGHAPAEQGELIVATPERIEAILRNPAYDKWSESIGAICVDEAHLISSQQRGPTLEYLITSFLTLPAPPRFVLLSATMGDVTAAQQWLHPCAIVNTTDRYPLLHKQVIALDANEDANHIIATVIRSALQTRINNVLVFVYQTRSAEALAKTLSDKHDIPTLAYHSRMSRQQRADVRMAFEQGQVRCLVATSSLAMGVNLPASHVIVRDTTFYGFGRLTTSDLLQMMGRAGRGDSSGHATVIIRPNDSWEATALAAALKNEQLPTLSSPFAERTAWHQPETEIVAIRLAALLARKPEDGFSAEALQRFFERSLGGQQFTRHIPSALDWLTDPFRILAWQDENDQYRLTVLGLKSTRAVLPLPLASGYAQLMRDLLSIDSTDRLLASWRPLDHLLVLNLLHERSVNIRRFSQRLVTQVDSWMEKNPKQVPLLYREWVRGDVETSKSAELLGSLGLLPSDKNAAKAAHRRAYLATFHAIILFERGQGIPSKRLERQWRVQNLEGIEEKWRDETLWLLSGIGRLLDIRTFYYHLREECSADYARIKSIKRTLRTMWHQTFTLQEQLKYCSPLGPLLRSIRRSRGKARGATVGIQTIRKLENAGICSIQQLTELSFEALVDLGIRRDLAKQIKTYTRKRLL